MTAQVPVPCPLPLPNPIILYLPSGATNIIPHCHQWIPLVFYYPMVVSNVPISGSAPKLEADGVWSNQESATASCANLAESPAFVALPPPNMYLLLLEIEATNPLRSWDHGILHVVYYTLVVLNEPISGFVFA